MLGCGDVSWYHFEGFKIVRGNLINMFSEAIGRPCRGKVRSEPR